MTLEPIGIGGVVGTVVLGLVGFYSLHSLKPTVERQRAAVRSISEQLILHAPFIFNPGSASDEKTKEVSEALRKRAAQLSASTEGVGFYSVLALVQLVHAKDAVETAHRSLIGLSNSIGSGDSMWNARLAADLEDALGLGTNLGYRRADFEDETNE